MKQILLLLILVILSCKQQSYKNKTLDFEQVTYFHIQIEDQDLFDMASQDRLTALQQFKVDVLLKTAPESLPDTLFIENLEESGFTKNEISREKLSRLKSLFSIENNQPNQVKECINIYRDILNFRTKDEITGLAKICLECEMIYVVNSNEKWSIQLSEYDMSRLEQLNVHKSIN